VLALVFRSVIVIVLPLPLMLGVPKMPAGGAETQEKPGLGSLIATNDPEAALPVSCQVIVCWLGLRLNSFALLC